MYLSNWILGYLVLPISFFNVFRQVLFESRNVFLVPLVKIFPKLCAPRTIGGVLFVELVVAPNGIHQFRELLDEIVVMIRSRNDIDSPPFSKNSKKLNRPVKPTKQTLWA